MYERDTREKRMSEGGRKKDMMLRSVIDWHRRVRREAAEEPPSRGKRRGEGGKKKREGDSSQSLHGSNQKSR